MQDGMHNSRCNKSIPYTNFGSHNVYDLNQAY
jgi:hypothetical protein